MLRDELKSMFLLHQRVLPVNLPNGVKENFDKQGRLIRIFDKQGKVEISWSSKQIQLMDERGRRLTFTLDKKGGKNKNSKIWKTSGGHL